MKEVTLIGTIEATDIVRLTDEEFEEQFGDFAKVRHEFESSLGLVFKDSDDVHTKVQLFVRDVND